MNQKGGESKCKGLPSSYWQRVKEIRAAQNFSEFYSHYFSRHFSVFLTAALTYTSITPNKVPLSMLFWGLLGRALFSMGEPMAFFLGGLSLDLLSLSDAADCD